MAKLLDFVVHNILYNIIIRNVVHNSLKKVINCLKIAQNYIMNDIINNIVIHNSFKGNSHYMSKAGYRTAMLKQSLL